LDGNSTKSDFETNENCEQKVYLYLVNEVNFPPKYQYAENVMTALDWKVITVNSKGLASCVNGQKRTDIMVKFSCFGNQLTLT